MIALLTLPYLIHQEVASILTQKLSADSLSSISTAATLVQAIPCSHRRYSDSRLSVLSAPSSCLPLIHLLNSSSSVPYTVCRAAAPLAPICTPAPPLPPPCSVSCAHKGGFPLLQHALLSAGATLPSPPCALRPAPCTRHVAAEEAVSLAHFTSHSSLPLCVYRFFPITV